MKTFVAFVRAFSVAYTYDARRNSYLWLGVFWGLLIPFFTIAFDLSLQAPERRGLIDLNGFKAVNDEYGHARGDRVLCDAVASLRSVLRQSDVLGRHGGDEFILLSPADRPSAARLVERAVEAVNSRTGLGLSAGIAGWPEDGQTPDELIATADQRLGASKRKSHDSRSLPIVSAPRVSKP